MASKFCAMGRLGELTIQSTANELEKVTSFVGTCGARVGLRNREILDLQISADEACSNSIAYAYPGTAGQIRIACDATDGWFSVTVVDSGVPFDPLALPEPDLEASLDSKSLGGLGIHLIRTLMDKVTYERRDEQNVLTMRKKV